MILIICGVVILDFRVYYYMILIRRQKLKKDILSTLSILIKIYSGIASGKNNSIIY